MYQRGEQSIHSYNKYRNWKNDICILVQTVNWLMTPQRRPVDYSAICHRSFSAQSRGGRESLDRLFT